MRRKSTLLSLLGCTVFSGCAATSPLGKADAPEFEGRVASLAPQEANVPVVVFKPAIVNALAGKASPQQPPPPAVAAAAAPRRDVVHQTVSHSSGRGGLPAKAAGYRANSELMEVVIGERGPFDQLASPPSPVHPGSVNHPGSINLPTALSMVGPQHPAVGFAQWRVQQAYAEFDQARVLWLPTLRAGFSFHRHDGNYQASNGDIVDVNRNSFQYGLGAGATGAGTTPFPGVFARFRFADAIFQPKIAGRTAAARCHESRAVTNRQMMNAAVAYLQLLGAHQGVRVMEEIRERTAELTKLTSDFAATGAGLQADADRMATELALVDSRVLVAREQAGVAGAQLARVISADPQMDWIPTEITVMPLSIVTLKGDRGGMIATGLMRRPELREAQSLVAAACERYRREKFAPLVPSVLLGFSNGGFGGGLGNNLSNVDGRYDFDALVAWEVRNFGLGEHAARRNTSAQIQQAKYEKLRVMDQVASEISEAYLQVNFRSQQVGVAEKAIQTAVDSYQRNLRRIRDGQGLPLESLQSLQALENAQRGYIDAVTGYNQAQFRLQWALGWPVCPPAQQPDVVVSDVAI